MDWTFSNNVWSSAYEGDVTPRYFKRKRFGYQIDCWTRLNIQLNTEVDSEWYPASGYRLQRNEMLTLIDRFLSHLIVFQVIVIHGITNISVLIQYTNKRFPSIFFKCDRMQTSIIKFKKRNYRLDRMSEYWILLPRHEPMRFLLTISFNDTNIPSIAKTAFSCCGIL